MKIFLQWKKYFRYWFHFHFSENWNHRHRDWGKPRRVTLKGLRREALVAHAVVLTSGWGMAYWPGTAYAWPPAKMTGAMAGFGRYGMVAPLGGD